MMVTKYGSGVVRRWAAIVTVGFYTGPGSITTAQQAAPAASRPLGVDAVLSQRAFGWVPTSMCAADSLVAYTVRSAERTEEERPGDPFLTASGVPFSGVGAEQWIISTRTGVARNVSGPRGVSWGGTWSPDCRTLAFFSNRDGAVRLWLWSAADGRVRRLSPVKLRPLQFYDVPQWTPNGKHIVVKLRAETAAAESASVPERSTAGVTIQGDVGHRIFVYRTAPSDSVTAARATAGVAAPFLADLGVITVADGAVRRVVRDLPIASYDVSPTGNTVLYTVNRGFASIETQDNQVEIWVQPLDGGASRVVVPRVFMGLFGRGVSWSPDGSRIAYCIGTSSESVRHDCYVVGVEGGAPRLATGGDHPQFVIGNPFPPLWDPQGDHLYLLGGDTLWRADVAAGTVKAVATVPGRRLRLIVASPFASSFWSPDDGASLYLHTQNPETEETGYAKVDLRTGRTRVVVEEPVAGAYRDAAGLEAGSRAVVYLVEGAGTPPDLWLATDGFRKRRRLTNINPRLHGVAFGRSRLVAWLGLDGQALQGALLMPPNYVSGRRYPLVVWVYGGARHSESVHKFGLLPSELNLQLLATRGYVVLAPDAPMRGEAPMLEIAKAVTPGVNRLVELGIADAARLGVGGTSFGGYSTMALVTQTTQFRAAVVIAGLSTNLMTDYGVMDSMGFGSTLRIIEEGQVKMGGTPWDRRSRYIENSPYFYLDRVRTPVLLMHGIADPTTSAFGADQTFTALRRLGKPVEYVKYEGVGHGFQFAPPAQQRDYLTRIIEWFDTHLAAAPGDSAGLPGAGEKIQIEPVRTQSVTPTHQRQGPPRWAVDASTSAAFTAHSARDRNRRTRRRSSQ